MFELIKHGLNGQKSFPRMWRAHDLNDHYDVVIIGGGMHGLAAAYYLAKDHGITNVAVLENAHHSSGRGRHAHLPPHCGEFAGAYVWDVVFDAVQEFD